MGFFRRLFGGGGGGGSRDKRPRRRWSFVRSLNDRSRLALPSAPRHYPSLGPGDLDASKHAIAVAAATAAVAEAALAAAQAAAEVVRLTSGGGGGVVKCAAPAQFGGSRPRVEDLAAVRIQSAFRGYLARRALRALKALVKLQALVRGHIVRKQMTDMLRRMQTLVRVQVRARAGRSYTSVSSHSSSKSSVSHHPRCGSNSNFRGNIDMEGAKFGSNWLDRWMEEGVRDDHGDAPPRHRHDDERSSKILEVDTWKPHLNSQRSRETYQSLHQAIESNYINQNAMVFESPSKYSSRAPNPVPSLSSEEILSLRSLQYPGGKGEMPKSADNSPQVNSLSSRPRSSSARRGPFTPTRSESSWGFFNGYSGHPNYMTNTESSRAKVRSQSAPRQRLEFDRYGMAKRSLQASWDAGATSERNYPLYADLRSKGKTVSNRLDRLGTANLR